MTAMASGDFVAIVAASSKVNDSSRSQGTRWLMSSHSLALRASIGAAVKNISLMTLMGSRPWKFSSPVDIIGQAQVRAG